MNNRSDSYTQRRHTRRRTPLRGAARPGLWLLSATLLAACGNDDAISPAPPVVFEVEVAEQETFRIALHDAAQIDAAEQMMASGRSGIVHGTLVRGDGGFNSPYSWHLEPETITFPDMAMEVCSGRPLSDVEADLDYWVGHLGIYCPWGARILRRLP